jgi:hypothetical protein
MSRMREANALQAVSKQNPLDRNLEIRQRAASDPSRRGVSEGAGARLQ